MRADRMEAEFPQVVCEVEPRDGDVRPVWYRLVWKSDGDAVVEYSVGFDPGVVPQVRGPGPGGGSE